MGSLYVKGGHFDNAEDGADTRCQGIDQHHCQKKNYGTICASQEFDRDEEVDNGE